MIYVGIDIAKDKLDRFITNSNVVWTLVQRQYDIYILNLYVLNDSYKNLLCYNGLESAKTQESIGGFAWSWNSLISPA